MKTWLYTSGDKIRKKWHFNRGHSLIDRSERMNRFDCQFWSPKGMINYVICETITKRSIALENYSINK